MPCPEGHDRPQLFKLLRGEPFEAPSIHFCRTRPHGQGTFTEKTKPPGRSINRAACAPTKFKLIYNCTPHHDLCARSTAPAILTGRRWPRCTTKASSDAKFDRAYFTTPRPIYELYDLEKDPGEMENVAGKLEYAKAEQELKAALQDKMILDYDYLPLPLADKGMRKGIVTTKNWCVFGCGMATRSATTPLRMRGTTTSPPNFLSRTFSPTSRFSVIRWAGDWPARFRYPHLSEGDTSEKRRAVRQFLKSMPDGQNYRIAQVTVDFADWFVPHGIRPVSENRGGRIASNGSSV